MTDTKPFSIEADAVLTGAMRADLADVVLLGNRETGGRYVAASGTAGAAVKALREAADWIEAGCPAEAD